MPKVKGKVQSTGASHAVGSTTLEMNQALYRADSKTIV
jgi:hypothetical protein